jgi:hypothetical protein
MQWNRSEAIGTSSSTCAHCHGEGLRQLTRKKHGSSKPCNCTLRGVFRACLAKFRECVEKPKHLSRATLQTCSGKEGYRVWGRKDEEYMADFYLLAKRNLDEEHFRIFKFHFLLGADWRLCCRRLNMERGNFFHAVYRIQQQLGRVFRETKPFALFPLDEYFGGTIQKDSLTPLPPTPKILQMPTIGVRKALRPPLQQPLPKAA